MKDMVSINDRYRKIMLSFFCCIFFLASGAQKGNDLLVYAVKGTVTTTYNNQESPVKIGKVLRTGASINLRPGARLTMVCKQGKPLAVDREGVFPLERWRDSCKSGTNSMTSNYFKYIWTELYARSPEHAEEDKGVNAVTRGEAPSRVEYYPNRVKIEFSRGLDTLNYVSGDFPLSWTCYDYDGKYLFKLYDAKTGKLIYKDSLFRSYIMISKFKELLVPGKRYSWTVSAPKAGIIKKRILN